MPKIDFSNSAAPTTHETKKGARSGPMPTPEKLHYGGDYDRWESRARGYIEQYPKEKRLYILHSLLDD